MSFYNDQSTSNTEKPKVTYKCSSCGGSYFEREGSGNTPMCTKCRCIMTTTYTYGKTLLSKK